MDVMEGKNHQCWHHCLLFPLLTLGIGYFLPNVKLLSGKILDWLI